MGIKDSGLEAVCLAINAHAATYSETEASYAKACQSLKEMLPKGIIAWNIIGDLGIRAVYSSGSGNRTFIAAGTIINGRQVSQAFHGNYLTNGIAASVEVNCEAGASRLSILAYINSNLLASFTSSHTYCGSQITALIAKLNEDMPRRTIGRVAGTDIALLCGLASRMLGDFASSRVDDEMTMRMLQSARGKPYIKLAELNSQARY